jgi:hypothetical protein
LTFIIFQVAVGVTCGLRLDAAQAYSSLFKLRYQVGNRGVSDRKKVCKIGIVIAVEATNSSGGHGWIEAWRGKRE